MKDIVEGGLNDGDGGKGADEMRGQLVSISQ